MVHLKAKHTQVNTTYPSNKAPRDLFFPHSILDITAQQPVTGTIITCPSARQSRDIILGHVGIVGARDGVVVLVDAHGTRGHTDSAIERFSVGGIACLLARRHGGDAMVRVSVLAFE